MHTMNLKNKKSNEAKAVSLQKERGNYMGHMFSVLLSKKNRYNRKSMALVRATLGTVASILVITSLNVGFNRRVSMYSQIATAHAESSDRIGQWDLTGFLEERTLSSQLIPSYQELAQDTLLGIASLPSTNQEMMDSKLVWNTPFFWKEQQNTMNWTTFGLFGANQEQNTDALLAQKQSFENEEKEKTKRKAKKKKKQAIKLAQHDKEVLLRIVEAEAGDEDVEGRMLVANVVLNRVNCKTEFPDSVTEVVFDHSIGVYQFSPVADGSYYNVTVTKGTREAVKRVLDGEDKSKGALYFMARAYSDSDNVRWFDSCLTYLFTYADHEFYK